MEISKIKETLQPIFKKHKDKILFSYLFGSVVQKTYSPLSDIDIAVFLKKGAKNDFFNYKMELYSDISRQLKRDDIDILVLNTAKNIILLDDIMRNNIILFDSNANARFDFECKTLHQCIDFKEHRRALFGV